MAKITLNAENEVYVKAIKGKSARSKWLNFLANYDGKDVDAFTKAAEAKAATLNKNAKGVPVKALAPAVWLNWATKEGIVKVA